MQELEKLLQIMADLRNPDGGCPWDIKQSFKSVAAYTVEEAYEVADAIERGDMDDLKSELGDLLFQVVFHAQMASEKNQFDFSDVVQEINDKMVRRHPHVFAGDGASDEDQLNRDWEQHKKKERTLKNQIDENQSVSYLDGIVSTMPALRWSEKLQKRASHHGFDWDDIQSVFDKVNEEIGELKAEIDIENNHERIVDEMGDILFASVNLARHVGVNPEQALRDSNRKFISRFEIVEQLLRDDEKLMEGCSVDVLLEYWQKAKQLIHRRDAEARRKV
ncbi:Nucleoside triphosphate pyrophosphohydrolase MazG [hydrothermal vent metagenome]|uniref:Nucleoside triphosphate pyrophosphohydrolase MazG n=1 Tax=hydrothermal vent metagenome TaxID=652676 RepID=A0A3B0W4J5_9ZZZZ